MPHSLMSIYGSMACQSFMLFKTLARQFLGERDYPWWNAKSSAN